MRLPYEVRPLFLEWLEQHYPLKKQKVINYLKSLRGGEINDPSFKTRMSGKGNYAELIRQRFVVSCKKHKVETKREFELDVSSFEASTQRNQLSLF